MARIYCTRYRPQRRTPGRSPPPVQPTCIMPSLPPFPPSPYIHPTQDTSPPPTPPIHSTLAPLPAFLCPHVQLLMPLASFPPHLPTPPNQPPPSPQPRPPALRSALMSSCLCVRPAPPFPSLPHPPNHPPPSPPAATPPRSCSPRRLHVQLRLVRQVLSPSFLRPTPPPPPPPSPTIPLPPPLLTAPPSCPAA